MGSTDVTTWDLSGGAPLSGDSIVVGLIEGLRRYGAVDVEVGYRWDPAWGEDTDDAEPPPGAATTWYAVVTLQSVGRSKRRRTRWVDTAECIAEPGGRTHEEALVEALSALIRRRGGHVSVVKL